MAKTIRLEVVSPERLVFQEDVKMVIARTTGGDIGVLPGHAPLLAGLEIWPVRVMRESGEFAIAVCGGIIEVLPERITLLAQCAELPEEIDLDRAEAAKERAVCRIRETGADIDHMRAELALKRAIMRIRTVQQKL